MFAIAALLLASSLPHPSRLCRGECDLIEFNTVYGDTGNVSLVQVIYWDWSAQTGCYRVVAWRNLRTPTTIHRSPRGYLDIYSDGANRREVFAKSYRETFTAGDPEVQDRERWAVESRRPLFKTLTRSN